MSRLKEPIFQLVGAADEELGGSDDPGDSSPPADGDMGPGIDPDG